MSGQGHLITIEGIEGAGKSTACIQVAQWLAKQNIPCIKTREPGGTYLGERVRQLLLNEHDLAMTAEAELLLLFACRAQHLETVIYPALARGEWVVCDRFTDASFAYQGAGRGLAQHRVDELETWLQNDFRPSLTLVLDLDPKIGMERIKQHRGLALDRIEQETHDFFNRVRWCYLNRAKSNPQRYRVIDAGHDSANVSSQIEKSLEQFWEPIHGK